MGAPERHAGSSRGTMNSWRPEILMRFKRPGLPIAAFFALVSFGLLVAFADQASQLQSSPPAPPTNSSLPDARVLITISGKKSGNLPTPAKTDFAVLDNRRSAEITDLRSLKG